MINTIVFDVDGTLYDETHAKLKAELSTAEYIADKSGVDRQVVYKKFREVKDAVVKAYSGLPKRNDRKLWYEGTLQHFSIDSISAQEACDHYWTLVCDSIEPYCDLVAVLPMLSQKYKLYSLTDEFLEIQKSKLEHLGLETYFIEVFSSEQVGETKPSQALFNYVLDKIGEPPSSVVMVGDNPSADIKGGNLSGMRTAWLKRGKYFYYLHDDIEKPDVTLRTYLELDMRISTL